MQQNAVVIAESLQLSKETVAKELVSLFSSNQESPESGTSYTDKQVK